MMSGISASIIRNKFYYVQPYTIKFADLYLKSAFINQAVNFAILIFKKN